MSTKNKPRGRKKKNNRHNYRPHSHPRKDIVVFFGDSDEMLTPVEIDFMKNADPLGDNHHFYVDDMGDIYFENPIPKALNKADRKKKKRQEQKLQIETEKKMTLKNKYMNRLNSKFTKAKDPESLLQPTEDVEFVILKPPSKSTDVAEDSIPLHEAIEKLSISEAPQEQNNEIKKDVINFDSISENDQCRLELKEKEKNDSNDLLQSENLNFSSIFRIEEDSKPSKNRIVTNGTTSKEKCFEVPQLKKETQSTPLMKEKDSKDIVSTAKKSSTKKSNDKNITLTSQSNTSTKSTRRSRRNKKTATKVQNNPKKKSTRRILFSDIDNMGNSNEFISDYSPSLYDNLESSEENLFYDGESPYFSEEDEFYFSQLNGDILSGEDDVVEFDYDDLIYDDEEDEFVYSGKFFDDLDDSIDSDSFFDIDTGKYLHEISDSDDELLDSEEREEKFRRILRAEFNDMYRNNRRNSNISTSSMPSLRRTPERVAKGTPQTTGKIQSKKKKNRKLTRKQQRLQQTYDRKVLFKLNNNFRRFVERSEVGEIKGIDRVNKKQRRQLQMLAKLYKLDIVSFDSRSKDTEYVGIQKTRHTEMVSLQESKDFIRSMFQSPDENSTKKSKIRARFNNNERIVGENSEPISSDNIGFVLLKQFGWTGGGLGANEQGLKDPIQVLIKKNKTGLGF